MYVVYIHIILRSSYYNRYKVRDIQIVSLRGLKNNIIHRYYYMYTLYLCERQIDKEIGKKKERYIYISKNIINGNSAAYLDG